MRGVPIQAPQDCSRATCLPYFGFRYGLAKSRGDLRSPFGPQDMPHLGVSIGVYLYRKWFGAENKLHDYWQFRCSSEVYFTDFPLMLLELKPRVQICRSPSL